MLCALLAFSPDLAQAHGAYHSVVHKLERLIERHPESAELRYRLALAHSDHEEWKLCLEEIEIIEKLEPGKHPTGYLRGLSFHQAGKSAEAREALDDFLSKHPSHAGALSTRGAVLMSLKFPDEAASDVRMAIRQTKQPGPDLYLQLAECLKAAGKTSDALAAIDEALGKLGFIPELQHRGLEFSVSLKEWDSALARIAAIRDSAPRPEPWMAAEARLLAQAGRPQEARSSWLALRDHLDALPSLDRGTPANLALMTEAKSALGETLATPVSIPPAAN